MCKTYYVNPLTGKDENDGLHEDRAFATLFAVNRLALAPGDTVLLRRGCRFEKQFLQLQCSGTEGSPITIGAYGEGCAPCIAADGQGIWYQDYGCALDSPTHVHHGYVSSAVLLYDAAYVTLRDLEITNRAEAVIGERYSQADKMQRTGVAVVAKDKGIRRGITLQNLQVHDVNGNVYDKHMNNGGIYMTALRPQNEAATGAARFGDILVEGCYVAHVSRWGIAVGYTYAHAQFQGAALDEKPFAAYGHENIVIRDNYVKAAGGDGITVMYALRPLVEHNTADSVACEMNDRIYSEPGNRLGKVAAASTSIGNGFEHHYEQVALAAEDYQKALEEGAPAKREAKSRVSKLLDQLRDACSSVGSFRIDADPPGGKGVVCLAVNTGPDAPDKGFESAFVQASGQLGCRVAISAATLVADPSGEGRSVIASLTDGLASDSALAGVLGAAAGVWSGALSTYADGQSALDAAVREGLGGLPLVSASGLGDWAADALSDAFRAVGLQPANLDALRPATVNTAHVAQAGDSAFCARLLEVKRQAVEHPLMSNDVFSSVVGAVRRDVLQRFDAWGDSVEVATISIGGAQVPVTVALPPAVKGLASDAIGAAADKLLSVYASVTGLRQWD